MIAEPGPVAIGPRGTGIDALDFRRVPKRRDPGVDVLRIVGDGLALGRGEDDEQLVQRSEASKERPECGDRASVAREQADDVAVEGDPTQADGGSRNEPPPPRRGSPTAGSTPTRRWSEPEKTLVLGADVRPGRARSIALRAGRQSRTNTCESTVSVDDDVLEDERLAVAAGKLHPHGLQHQRRTIDPEVRPVSSCRIWLRVGVIDTCQASAIGRDPRRDREVPAELVRRLVDEIFVRSAACVGDVRPLAHALAGHTSVS